MAVTSKSVQSSDQPTPTEKPTEQAETKAAAPTSPGQEWDGYHCVVPDSDPTPHMGRATPGAKICSAHAMHYLADGTPRDAR
jgi:hypothetical protein